MVAKCHIIDFDFDPIRWTVQPFKFYCSNKSNPVFLYMVQYLHSFKTKFIFSISNTPKNLDDGASFTSNYSFTIPEFFSSQTIYLFSPSSSHRRFSSLVKFQIGSSVQREPRRNGNINKYRKGSAAAYFCKYFAPQKDYNFGIITSLNDEN